ncbi:17132_t:CDS:2, partial [Racocetra fulgida]
MTRHSNKRKHLIKITEDRESKKQRSEIYKIVDSLDHEELIKIQNYIASINPQQPNIYKLIDSLDQEELIKIQNYINLKNPQQPNIYKLIESFDQEELIKIQNYVNSKNPQQPNIYELIDVVKKKFDKIVDKVKGLPDYQIPRFENLINSMTYSKGKSKGEILSPYLQNKAIEFVNSGLFKHYSSANAVQDKIKQLETENNKLAKLVEKSNNELKSFRMKIVRAKEAKQKYISKIRSISQKKITKSQFKIAVKKMIKQNNNEYSSEFVRFATNISNIGTISLSAASECTKAMLSFLISETPDYWPSKGTLSRWNKEVSKISLHQNRPGNPHSSSYSY